MNGITVTLGDKLFEFKSFEDWVNTAARRFQGCGYRSDNVICLDAKGRICFIGKQFMRARDEETFPVTVYVKTV